MSRAPRTSSKTSGPAEKRTGASREPREGVLVQSDPREGAKRARAEMYRRLILDGAEKVFAERGFDEAKMQDIAHGAGIALGTLYSVFPGKNEIYAAIQEQRGREMIEGIYRAIQGHAGVVDACARGIDAYVRTLVERPHFLRMHLRDGLSWTDPSSLRNAVEVATWERGMSLAVDLLRLGIERGYLHASRPELVLKMMVATHQVQLRDWLERGARNDEVDALITSMQAHFVRAFVRDAQAGESPAPEIKRASG
jgi:AcrR family transcriptional regulator